MVRLWPSTVWPAARGDELDFDAELAAHRPCPSGAGRGTGRAASPSPRTAPEGALERPGGPRSARAARQQQSAVARLQRGQAASTAARSGGGSGTWTHAPVLPCCSRKPMTVAVGAGEQRRASGEASLTSRQLKRQSASRSLSRCSVQKPRRIASAMSGHRRRPRRGARALDVGGRDHGRARLHLGNVEIVGEPAREPALRRAEIDDDAKDAEQGGGAVLARILDQARCGSPTIMSRSRSSSRSVPSIAQWSRVRMRLSYSARLLGFRSR
jgi:hypothetical protein